MVIAMFAEGLWLEYLPLFFLNIGFIAMFLAPVYIRTMDTYTHRTRTAWYYLFCIAILGHVWIVLGLTGIGVDELKKICIDNDVAETYYNGDNIRCRDEQRLVLIGNVFVFMLVQLYYSYILKTYAEMKQDETDHSHALY